MNVIKHHMLVDLDVLVDTRLSTLHLIDENLPIRVLNGGYYERLSDQMENVITKEERNEFLHRYRNRADNPKTLKLALPTNMNRYISDFYNGYTADQIVANSRNRSKCTINIFPYFLTDDEKRDVVNLLIYDLYGYCDIDVTRIDTSKVDINQLLSNYDEYLTYESSNFINHWLVDYDTVVAPGFKLVIPKLAIGNKDAINVKDEEPLSKEMLYDGLEAVRTAYSGIFYLGFLPPKYYCPRKRARPA